MRNNDHDKDDMHSTAMLLVQMGSMKAMLKKRRTRKRRAIQHVDSTDATAYSPRHVHVQHDTYSQAMIVSDVGWRNHSCSSVSSGTLRTAS